MKEFPSEENLLRNMTGLLTKVAEEQSLLPQLMSAAFVRELVGLLNSIKVSYNAVEVLVYLLSDGSEAWTILQPTRAEVLGQIFCIMWSLVVLKWDFMKSGWLHRRVPTPGVMTMLC